MLACLSFSSIYSNASSYSSLNLLYTTGCGHTENLSCIRIFVLLYFILYFHLFFPQTLHTSVKQWVPFAITLAIEIPACCSNTIFSIWEYYHGPGESHRKVIPLSKNGTMYIFCRVLCSVTIIHLAKSHNYFICSVLPIDWWTVTSMWPRCWLLS